ncbi:MAG: IS5/IS1182 family transposase, partial [Enterococcus larvae]
ALNLRKLGKHMERKRRKEEKTSPILILIIKIRLVFFLRVDYCPTLLSLVLQRVNVKVMTYCRSWQRRCFPLA